MKALDIEENVTWFKLTSEEADRLLDPYDPNDKDMPGYKHTNRHRYVREDSYQWLLDNIGKPNWDWFIQCAYDGVTAAIRDKDKALLFKLAFGGQ